MHDIMPNYTYISIVVLFYGNYIFRANKSRCLMQYGWYTNWVFTNQSETWIEILINAVLDIKCLFAEYLGYSEHCLAE